MRIQDVPRTAVDVRAAFQRWLHDHADDMAPYRAVGGDLDAVFRDLRSLQRLLFGAGWIRLGWPEAVGGLGGPLVLRAVVSEELAIAGYPPPFSFATQEVLAPAVVEHGPPQLAADVLPKLLSGEESWCQGFSEPEAGSDLASLRLKAVDDADAWRLTGEKIWTSWAQFADRCLLLGRTGASDSGHRGITAMLLDMDTPGIEVRPLRSMDGDEEFCSLRFDDVRVPKDRTIGEVNGGWAIARHVLACERGAAAWQRQSWMHRRLHDLLQRERVLLSEERIGEAFELVHALRLLSRRTVRALSAGHSLGPTPSFDKLLMSTAEKFLFDAAFDEMPDDILFGDDAAAGKWRSEYLYSRASSIYGGTAEIQRNIVADRILGLPRG